jgi:hypothetical protein
MYVCMYVCTYDSRGEYARFAYVTSLRVEGKQMHKMRKEKTSVA